MVIKGTQRHWVWFGHYIIDVLDVLNSCSFKEGFHFQEQQKSDWTRTREYSGWLIANMPQLASIYSIITAEWACVLSHSRNLKCPPPLLKLWPPLKTRFNKLSSTCNKIWCFSFRQKLFVDHMVLMRRVQKGLFLNLHKWFCSPLHALMFCFSNASKYPRLLPNNEANENTWNSSTYLGMSSQLVMQCSWSLSVRLCGTNFMPISLFPISSGEYDGQSSG